MAGAWGTGLSARVPLKSQAHTAWCDLHLQLLFPGCRYADTPEEKARKMAKKDSSSGPLSLSPPQQTAGGFLDAYQQAAGSPVNMACSGLPAGFTGYSAAGVPDPAGELPGLASPAGQHAV